MLCNELSVDGQKHFMVVRIMDFDASRSIDNLLFASARYSLRSRLACQPLYDVEAHEARTKCKVLRKGSTHCSVDQQDSST